MIAIKYLTIFFLPLCPVQVMIAPRGSTSWVRVERSSPLPHYAVQQGYFPRGSRAYICRTYHAADVLVAGNFNDDDGKCYYEYGNADFNSLLFSVLILCHTGL